MKTKKEVNTKKFVNNTNDDGYFDWPDGYADKSKLYADPGTVSNKTSTLLSSNVIIRSDRNIVGAIQRFDFWEHTDGDSVLINGQCSRVCFDKINILEAFTGQPNIEPIKKFDIEIIYQYPDETMITIPYTSVEYPGPCIVLSGVKITNRHTYFDVEKFVVVEDINFTAEKIVTKRFLQNQRQH